MPTADPIVSAIAEKYRNNPTYVLQILREAQEALDWISPETVETVASQLKIPRTRVQSVLQFYSFLYDKPRGRYRLLLADNITDRMAGNIALFEHMLSRLKLKRGQVSSDGLVSVDLTSDTGMCDQGPAMLANNRAIPRLTMRRIDEICDLVKARAPLDEWPAELFRVEDNIRRRETLLTPIAPGVALDAAIARGRQGMLDEMKRSYLRGRGGAGFPVGTKWDGARNAPGAERYIVCNADEGEPGTFKDRVLLNSFSVRVLEGMAIAGYVSGATKGFIYLRGEYKHLQAKLQREIDEMRAGLRASRAGRACGRRRWCRSATSANRRWSTTSNRSPTRPRSPSKAARASPSAAPGPRPAPSSFPFPATASGRASTSISSASRLAACWRIAAPRRSARCRSAALRASW
jgi:[NiFe] hydrogenase diaphorase moiety large subunit